VNPVNGFDGWLPQAQRYDSPYYDARPGPVPDDITLLVVHNISLPGGQFGGRTCPTCSPAGSTIMLTPRSPTCAG
jgi:hypothetical protein